MKNDPIDLNDYHKQQSARLAKEVSEQPPMSSEESMRQMKRLASKTVRRRAETADEGWGINSNGGQLVA